MALSTGRQTIALPAYGFGYMENQTIALPAYGFGYMENQTIALPAYGTNSVGEHKSLCDLDLLV